MECLHIMKGPSTEDATADLMRVFSGPCQATFENQV